MWPVWCWDLSTCKLNDVLKFLNIIILSTKLNILDQLNKFYATVDVPNWWLQG